METLPSEILQQVFDYLGDNDIVNLPARTVSRGLPESSISSRFATIDILLEIQSLERRKYFHHLFLPRRSKSSGPLLKQ